MSGLPIRPTGMVKHLINIDVVEIYQYYLARAYHSLHISMSNPFFFFFGCLTVPLSVHIIPSCAISAHSVVFNHCSLVSAVSAACAPFSAVTTWVASSFSRCP